ncbi:hypothetical protein BKA69DRAFT_1038867 [Paraphysoderma sedebokerense]|nr:hypothetical protein BKA69DRAFT_1038867 [Paraphysoderma sedebokerense]
MYLSDAKDMYLSDAKDMYLSDAKDMYLSDAKDMYLSDAKDMLTIYQNVLTSSANVTPIPWQNLTDFLPDCRAEFRRCVNNSLLSACGHVHHFGSNPTRTTEGRSTGTSTLVEHQVIPLLEIVGTVWRYAHQRTYFGLTPMMLPQQTLNLTMRDGNGTQTSSTRFLVGKTLHGFQQFASTNISNGFYGYANVAEHIAFGVCGNYMSICTFNENTWPNASQSPTTFDSYASTHTFTECWGDRSVWSYITAMQKRILFTIVGSSSFFGMTTQGIQLWTVPDTGYRIICAGAEGGSNVHAVGWRKSGVRDTGCNAGGGGGSYVWSTQSASEPLIAAGGGGGGRHNGGNGLPGSMTTAGTGTHSFGRTAGTPGGAGWKSNGAVGFNGHNQQCLRPLEGGFGGSINVNAPGGAPTVGDGGFGGGASAAGQTCSSGGPGGGGGYSGGAGPFTNTDFTACSWWRRRFI